jgi:competence protein ComEC
LVNPFLIRDDIGFQLSFLALLGIIYIYPYFKKIFEKLYFDKFKFSRPVKDILAVTLSAQIATAPVLYYNFGSISLIAPLSNLAVLWLLPFLLIFLFSGLFLALLFPELSNVFFLPAGLILKYILFVSKLCAEIPYSAFTF